MEKAPGQIASAPPSSTTAVGGGGKKSTAAAAEVQGKGAADKGGISSERAFADYVFGSLILHAFCVNFIN